MCPIQIMSCAALQNKHPFYSRRICPIVENNNIRQNRLKELEKLLVSQDYSQNLTHDAIKKVVQ